MIRFSENYEYGICSPENEGLIREMADCLAETFTGVRVGSTIIEEPMCLAVNLSKDVMFQFVVEYLKNVSGDGLCVFAKDKNTGRIVGALACENFNPDEEPPVLEGSLEPVNSIIHFLWRLDKKFIETVEYKTKKKMKRDEYVHSLLIGVRTEKDKKHIGAKMLELMLEEARKKNYKGIFVEATNFRSQRLITDFFEYYHVRDKSNVPISIRYKDDAVFNTIPENIAEECCLMYKPLHEDFIL